MAAGTWLDGEETGSEELGMAGAGATGPLLWAVSSRGGKDTPREVGEVKARHRRHMRSDRVDTIRPEQAHL